MSVLTYSVHFHIKIILSPMALLRHRTLPSDNNCHPSSPSEQLRLPARDTQAHRRSVRKDTGPSAEMPAPPSCTSQPFVWDSALTAHGLMGSGGAKACR